MQMNEIIISKVDKMDVITQPERRKLAALAFAQLLKPDGTKASVCLTAPVFPAVVAAVVEVLHDVCRSLNWWLIYNSVKQFINFTWLDKS